MSKSDEELIGQLFLWTLGLLVLGVLVLYLYSRNFSVDEFDRPSTTSSFVMKSLVYLFFSPFFILMSYLLVKSGIRRSREKKGGKRSTGFLMLMLGVMTLTGIIKVLIFDLEYYFWLDIVFMFVWMFIPFSFIFYGYHAIVNSEKPNMNN